MYKVIKHFCDLQDKNHPYNVGDTFPREGLKVTDERLAELAGSKNKQGKPLIELVDEAQAEKGEMVAENPEVAPAQPTKEAPAKKGVKKTADK